MNFNIPIPKYQASPEIRKLFAFREVERPSEWAEKNIVLGRGYGEPGEFSFKGREWQREILDSFLEYKTVIVCKPVQTGGSLCAIDIPWLWWNEFIGGRSLIVYADKDTVEGVFEEKIKDNVRNNIRHLWNGNEDNLRQDKIILNNGIARCATANAETDFATFPADFVGLDEVAKYRNTFDVVGMARGRQKSYWGLPGYHGLLSIVSSPKKHGDPLYNQIHKGGVLVLRYKMPCPWCHKFHELTDENIKETANDKGEFDHDPTRIRQEQAAQYECPDCKKIITDNHRWEMIAKGRWLAEGERVEKSGAIIGEVTARKKSDTVCFWYNRLLSQPDKWTFADCLAAFFEARHSRDPLDWQIYQNEDMARFVNPKTQIIGHSLLLSKCQKYFQFGERAKVPAGVVITTAGVDSQDTGFYYTVDGWGRNMESWRIRHDFIKCDMRDDTFNDPIKVLEEFKRGIFYPGYRREDGTEIGISIGLIDEGGHRQKDVRFICKHIPIFRSYKGSSYKNAEPLKKSKTDFHFMGNTQYWSDLVSHMIESEAWHLPEDVSKPFLDQVPRQYWSETRDRNGNVKYKWVSGGDDHYRDCVNLALAAAHLLNLPEKLNDEGKTKQLNEAVKKQSLVEKALVSQDPSKPEPEKKPRKREDPTVYRDRLRAGRRIW